MLIRPRCTSSLSSAEPLDAISAKHLTPVLVGTAGDDRYRAGVVPARVFDAARFMVAIVFFVSALAVRAVVADPRLAVVAVARADFFAVVAVDLAPDDAALAVVVTPDLTRLAVCCTPSVAVETVRRTSVAHDANRGRRVRTRPT